MAARLLQHITEPPRPCSYLPDETASLELLVQVEVSPKELQAALERGWRRFGPVYFRPACATCRACETLRIPVDTFRPSRSQSRAAKRVRDLDRQWGVPKVDEERLALYARWHSEREDKSGWDANPMTRDRYAFDFAFEHPAAREVTFRDPESGRLLAVGLCDQMPTALSAVYFYWDPDLASLSLGTAHVVLLLEDAKKLGLTHLYLGYHVGGCPSLAYKARFGPHEVLAGRPSDDETATYHALSPVSPSASASDAPHTEK